MSKCKNGHDHWTNCGPPCLKDTSIEDANHWTRKNKDLEDKRLQTLCENLAKEFNTEVERTPHMLGICGWINRPGKNYGYWPLTFNITRAYWVDKTKFVKTVNKQFHPDWTAEDWKAMEKLCKENL